MHKGCCCGGGPSHPMDVTWYSRWESPEWARWSAEYGDDVIMAAAGHTLQPSERKELRGLAHSARSAATEMNGRHVSLCELLLRSGLGAERLLERLRTKGGVSFMCVALASVRRHAGHSPPVSDRRASRRHPRVEASTTPAQVKKKRRPAASTPDAHVIEEQRTADASEQTRLHPPFNLRGYRPLTVPADDAVREVDTLEETCIRLPDAEICGRLEHVVVNWEELKARLEALMTAVSDGEGKRISICEMLLRPAWVIEKMRARGGFEGAWEAVEVACNVIRGACIEADLGDAESNAMFGRAHTEWVRSMPLRLSFLIERWRDPAQPPEPPSVKVYLLVDGLTGYKYVGVTKHQHPLIRYLEHFGHRPGGYVTHRLWLMGPLWNLRMYLLGRAKSWQSGLCAETYFMLHYNTLEPSGLNKEMNGERAVLYADFEPDGGEVDTAPVHVFLRGKTGRKCDASLTQEFVDAYGLEYWTYHTGSKRLRSVPTKSTDRVLTEEETAALIAGSRLPMFGETLADIENKMLPRCEESAVNCRAQRRCDAAQESPAGL